MSFIPTIETVSIAEQQEFQLKKIQEVLKYANDNSSFYKSKNYSIESIHSLNDFGKLSTTSKEDMQLFNMDFCCVSKSDIAEITSTSGTLGNPVSVVMTRKDIDRLAYNEYLSFELMELNEQDTVQLMLTLDRQFMAGIAYYLGLNKNGATIVRTGPGHPSMQIDCIKRLNVTALVAVPSFIIKLIEYCEKEHIEMNSLPVKKILCIGENIRNENFELNALGSLIKSKWDVHLFSTYASTEMQTAFTECKFGKGGHSHPELIYVEIVDDEGNSLKAGEVGEVCITTLDVEGMPLIRYRTGDICFYTDEICDCGRTTRRLSPVMGRKKQMIKYKGTTLYPPAIFELLNQCQYIKEYIVEVQYDTLGMDEILLHISTPLNADECERILKPFLQSKLRVIPQIHYLSSSEITAMQFPQGSRKAIKFIDNRKTN